MYRKGGCFLNNNGGQKFFNRPDSNDKRLKQMDFQSDAAWSIMIGIPEGKLVVDHAVSISVLHSMIREAKPVSAKEMVEILIQTYRLGVLTYEEDRNPKLANSVMPDGWRPGVDSPFVRYERAGIIGRISPT